MKKMKETKYYDIHGVVRIACNINRFPKHFEVGRIDEKDLDIIIEMGDFDFDKTGSERVEGCWVKNKNLYIEYEARGTGKQKILISDLFGRPVLRFTKLTHKNVDVGQFSHLMASIKLLQKGCMFVHSAGVAKDDKGYLITGWSEMGKSSTVFGLSKNREFGLMGDDTVILSKNGFIYSYPMVAGVFFHSKNVKNLKLSYSQKIKLMIKYLVAKLPPLYLYINPNLLVELSDIGRVVDKVRLEKTYFLSRGSGNEKLDRGVAIKKIISSTMHGHNRYFARDAFLLYCYLNNCDPNFIEKNVKKVLETAIGECILLRSDKKDFHKLIGVENKF